MIKILLSFVLVSISFFTQAQTCAGPGRAAATAQSVCGNLTFVETDVSACTGPNLFNNVCALDVISTDNSRWYKFHCYTSGTFGFLVTPNSGGDDYDWSVMDVTGHNPNDVFTMNLVVSFNLSAITGTTGCTPTGTLNSHCSGGVPGSQFNSLINLVAGHDYFLMVTNWSNSGQPYSISFSGTAILTNNAVPVVSNVTVNNCSNTQLRAVFSEDFLCNTITTLGTEFTISGGAATVTGTISDCQIGANSVPSVLINLSGPLAPGNYTLNIANGSDGNTFKNVCGILVAQGNVPFTVPAPALASVVTPVVYCQGATATALTPTGTNLLWYTAATGGTGSTTAPVPSTAVTGSTPYFVSATTGSCEGPRIQIDVNVTAPVNPVFTSVAPICAGATLAPLPTTSNNGVTGSWSPALDNNNTTTYTFTPAAGQCAATSTITITVNQPTVPAFTAVAPICSGATLAPLPTTSNNGVTGTWSPALDNTTTTTYTFTPTAGLCATSATLTITVNPVVTPAFTAVAPMCAGTTFSLPTTSNNGITGTWSPVFDNTATGTYTFTPTAGQCVTGAAVTMSVTVNPNVVPAFTAVAPICAGDALSPLPTTSNNGITGTWSPALNNTTTTTYTFTPAAGVCATTATLTITVNVRTVPAFTSVTPICAGGTLSALPTTSNNGITGTWSPALDNTTTTTYTFTPTAGICATTATMVITVNPIVTPAFTQVAPICAGGTLAALPATSNNGITGTWSPALDNTTTTTYTFTPAAGQCAVTATMIITVNSNVTPTFTAVAPICAGATLAALPTTSNNGITGTWSPALDNTTTTTYTFTPAAGVCAVTTTLMITVNPNVLPTFTPVAPICSGGTLSALPTTSNNGITGTWSPALNNTTTTTYTFTPIAGLCATTATMTIQVITVNPVFTTVAPICTGAALSPLPTTSNNGITGTWSPALDNTSTTTYTFTPTAGQCAVTATLTITVKPYPVVNIGNDTTICQGSAVQFLPVVVPAATFYQWRVEQVNATVPLSTIDTISIKNATVNPVDTVRYVLSAVLDGCATEDTVQVNVKWKPSIEAGANVTICRGDSTLLNGIVSHISGITDSIAWTPTDSLRTPSVINANTSQTWALPSTSTWYRVTAYTHLINYGCEFEVHDSVKVVIPARVIASAGRDTIAVINVVHQLHGTGGVQYNWWTLSPGVTINNPSVQNPTVILNTDASLFVEVKNAIGCTDTAQVFIKVYDGPAYYVPNAFSPNGDGLNDIFRAVPPGIATTIYFRVFDRYGNLMFETNQWMKGWDGTYKGKPAPSGVYVWSVKGVDKYNKPVEKQGTVMIVR